MMQEKEKLSPNQINFQIVENSLKKTIHKVSSFFNSSVNYRTFKEDLKKMQRNSDEVTNLIVQISVYGQFYQSQRVKQFQGYLEDALSNLQNLTFLKINLGGVDLKECKILIQNICKWVKKNFLSNKKKMKTFQFLTSNLTNCKLQHFSRVIQLGILLGSPDQQTDNSFQNLTLQFNNWSFQVTQDAPLINKKPLKRYQPNLDDLKKVFQSFSKVKGYFKYKKFRLQVSTWYYTPVQIILFLNNNTYPLKKDEDIQEQQFLKDFIKKLDSSDILKLLVTFVGECYQNMKDIEIFQLDFRNWHSGFKFKENKSKFEQIENTNAASMSIMSKRIGKYGNTGQQSKIQAKTFQKKFVF